MCMCVLSLAACGGPARSRPIAEPRAAVAESSCELTGFVWLQSLVVRDEEAGGEERAFELAVALLQQPHSEAEFAALASALEPPDGPHGFRGPWTIDSGIPRDAAHAAQCAAEGDRVGPTRLAHGWLVLRRMREQEVSRDERLDAALTPGRPIAPPSGGPRPYSATAHDVSLVLDAFANTLTTAAEAAAALACVASVASGGAACVQDNQ
jgi:hypothetical protein